VEGRKLVKVKGGNNVVVKNLKVRELGLKVIIAGARGTWKLGNGRWGKLSWEFVGRSKDW